MCDVKARHGVRPVNENFVDQPGYEQMVYVKAWHEARKVSEKLSRTNICSFPRGMCRKLACRPGRERGNSQCAWCLFGNWETWYGHPHERNSQSEVSVVLLFEGSLPTHGETLPRSQPMPV